MEGSRSSAAAGSSDYRGHLVHDQLAEIHPVLGTDWIDCSSQLALVVKVDEDVLIVELVQDCLANQMLDECDAVEAAD